MTAKIQLEDMFGSTIYDQETQSKTDIKYMQIDDPLEIRVRIATSKFLGGVSRATIYIDYLFKGIFLAGLPPTILNQKPPEDFWSSPAFLIPAFLVGYTYCHYNQKYHRKAEEEYRRRIKILEKRSEELNI